MLQVQLECGACKPKQIQVKATAVCHEEVVSAFEHCRNKRQSK